jgi:uncharacterized DUF497 family protein
LALEFEWDPRKAAANLAKHKVSFEEAGTFFGDLLGRMAVMYVERAEAVRMISARRATRRERKDYEENSQ